MKSTLFALALCIPLGAQSWTTVPDGYLLAEGATRAGVPGLGPVGTRQLVIGAAHLQGLVGREITALAFRRDANWSETGPQGTSSMVIRIGSSARSPANVDADFSVNLPQSVEAFRGAVTIPASNVIASPPPWSAPDIISFPFASPFAYAGGDLAIEIDGGATTPADVWWPVDGVEDDLVGSVTFEGQACGPRGGPNGFTGGVAESSLVLGGTALFDFFGQPGANALLLIGASTHPTPIDLAFLGAPGCELRVDFFAVVPRAVLPTGLAGFDDMAYARIPLPALPALLNGQLVAQWLEIGAVVTSSQTMRFLIAGRMPNLDMVTLLRFADGSVEIRPRQAPIVDFLVN